MPGKIRVLFVCSGPGVRGRIAEAILNFKHAQLFDAESSRFEEVVGPVIPQFISDLMAETGITLPEEFPESVFERHKNSESFDHVITLCNSSTKFECPIFKNNIEILYRKDAQRHGWSIPDFRTIGHLKGAEKKNAARAIRELIHQQVDAFVSSIIQQQLTT